MAVCRTARDVPTNPFIARALDTPLFGPGGRRGRDEAGGAGAFAGRPTFIAGRYGSGVFFIDCFMTTLVFDMASFIDFFIDFFITTVVFDMANFIDSFIARAFGAGRIGALHIERMAFIGMVDRR